MPTPKPAPVVVVPPVPEPPKDSDADSVIDAQDKCHDSPAGISVSLDGFTTKLTLQINFGLDSNQVEQEYDGEIAKAAQCINEYPGNLVYIDGHTDGQGATEYTQQRPKRRATAVKN